METKGCASFDEKQKLTDLLTSEKYLAATYNVCRLEAATGAVKSCLASIHEDEHRIADEIFTEMNARGWYPTENAEIAKIQSAKLKFEQQTSK